MAEDSGSKDSPPGGFYVVEKGNGVKHHRPEGPKPPEPPSNPEGSPQKGESYLFLRQKKEDLRDDTPSQDREDAIAAVNGKINALFAEGKQSRVGVFEGLQANILQEENRIGDTEMGGIHPLDAAQRIASFPTEEIERNARENAGGRWKEEYAGMATDYKKVAVMVIRRGWYQAQANHISDADQRDHLQRQADKLSADIEFYKLGDSVPERPAAIAELYAQMLQDKRDAAQLARTGETLEEKEERKEKEERMYDLQMEQMRSESEYYQRVMLGYDQFVSVEQFRASLDPKSFDGSPPPWYVNLPPEVKGMIRNRINMTNLARNVSDQGMVNFEGVVNVLTSLDRKAFNYQYQEQPGFQDVLLSTVDHLFEKNQDHFVFSADGLEIIKNFDEYKANMIKVTAEYLKSIDEDESIKKGFFISKGQTESPYTIAATAAMAAVDNLFRATGVYDSADETRKVTNTEVWAEQPRAFFNPIKGRLVKWEEKNPLAETDPDKRAELQRKQEKGILKGRNWGGPFGAYMRERIAHDENFKKAYADHEIKYIPDRLFFSLFDHTYFSDDATENYVKKGDFNVPNFERPGGRTQLSLSEALIQSQKTEANGFNFTVANLKLTLKVATNKNLNSGGARNYRALDLRELEKNDLYGGYADTRSHAVKMYLHLTGGDPKGRLSPTAYIDELMDLRNDDRMATLKSADGKTDLLWDEDFITAGIALAASPEGVVLGTSELVLKLEDSVYDSVATKAIEDDRLYLGMEKGFRQRILKKLNAADTNSTLAVWLYPLIGATPLSRRNRIKHQASVAMERYSRRQ